MFTVYCSHCGARTLIWPSQVDTVTNTDAGIVVRFHDSAGHRGALVTGVRARATVVGMGEPSAVVNERIAVPA